MPGPADIPAHQKDTRCWVCGISGVPHRTLRADIHTVGFLCGQCWALQPRGRNEWLRAASALIAVLGLPRAWHHSGLRSGWCQDVAMRRGIQAWHDVPKGTPPPAGRFGWLGAEALNAAAADLEQLDAEYEASRFPPRARRGASWSPARSELPPVPVGDARPGRAAPVQHAAGQHGRVAGEPLDEVANVEAAALASARLRAAPAHAGSGDRGQGA